MNFNLEYAKYFTEGTDYSPETKKAVIKKILGGYVREQTLTEWEKVLADAKTLKFMEAEAGKKVTARIEMGGNTTIKERLNDFEKKPVIGEVVGFVRGFF